MIKIENKKLIIEIFTTAATETLCDIQKGLISLLMAKDADSVSKNSEDAILGLLDAMMLNDSQIKCESESILTEI